MDEKNGFRSSSVKYLAEFVGAGKIDFDLDRRVFMSFFRDTYSELFNRKIKERAEKITKGEGKPDQGLTDTFRELFFDLIEAEDIQKLDNAAYELEAFLMDMNGEKEGEVDEVTFEIKHKIKESLGREPKEPGQEGKIIDLNKYRK